MISRRFRSTFHPIAFLALLFTFVSGPAAADTIYKYVGKPFDTFFGTACPPNCNVSGWFSVAAPLAPNLPLTEVTPTAFSFTDGIVTFDDSTAEAIIGVVTGADGEIIGWNSQFLIGNPATAVIWSGTNPPGCSGCSLIDASGDFTSRFASINNDPGSWSISAPPGPETITIGGTAVDDHGSFSRVAGATTVDFNALTLGTQDVAVGIATYTSVNIFRCATCSSTGDLLDDTTNGARAFANDDFAIDFSQPISYFGLYWGSPDPGNMIRIFNGDTQLVAFTGKDLLSRGVRQGLSGAAYVNFFAGPGESFTRVEITGTEFPFETDNHAFTVVDPRVVIRDLISTIQAFGLSVGPTNAFTSKLDAAAAALARNNRNAACGQLGAFIESLRTGRGPGLTSVQVQLLQNKANQLRSIVGCR